MFPSKFKKNSDKSLGFLFIRAYNLWHTGIKNLLQSSGLTHPQFVFLAVLGFLRQNNEHVTQKMISDFSDIDVMTVSQIAGLLEKKHLITRQEHPRDTRARSVGLTALGQETLEKAMPAVEALDDEFFGKLGDKEESFAHMLRQLLV